ncbi:MAG: imidazole glycerol phosphate synthase subunit HisH [Candidatus Omnitrophica bacterium]|nr:imidazole glycerol phosphate synthase subunit HisH [Candidatus Omnitrophota bacterium]
MIVVIDYQMGNVRSVAKAFESVGARVRVSAACANLSRARALVLPGVGAFAAGMRHLRALRLPRLLSGAVREGKPFLGICLGAQLLFTTSEEHGVHAGLDFMPGSVERFKPGLKIPHMGWNTAEYTAAGGRSPLLVGIPDMAYFYFVHSYFLRPRQRSVVLANTAYSRRFASIVGSGNLYGIQFHPEKSAEPGLKIIENFCRLAGEIL